MLEDFKKEANYRGEFGKVSYYSTGKECLDLFFIAGATKNVNAIYIVNAVIRAFMEDPLKTMKIVFFARDEKEGLGERRFFRIAINTLAKNFPETFRKNLPLIAEYGDFDDLCVLLDTPLRKDAEALIISQLRKDIEAMNNGQPASMLAKWIPDLSMVKDDSSQDTKDIIKRIAALLGMSECEYQKTISALYEYTDIPENRLRKLDDTFSYEAHPSQAKEFTKIDQDRYREFLDKITYGTDRLHADRLYPCDIVHEILSTDKAVSNQEYDNNYLFAANEDNICEDSYSFTINDDISKEKRLYLDAAWKSLPDLTASKHENILAVVDVSCSMTWVFSEIEPIDVALSLGIYFAEHNKGEFAGHFITASEPPKLVEIKGRDITEKVRYCNLCFDISIVNELGNVFSLLLDTAIRNNIPQEDMPSKICIISGMQFDGMDELPLFLDMKKRFNDNGYELPDVIFWNVYTSEDTIPVTYSETGAALVSGFTPNVFDMIVGGECTPESVMDKILSSERYDPVS